MSQHEIDIQMGEIEACHASESHGIAARHENEDRLAQRHEESFACDAALADAIETRSLNVVSTVTLRTT